MNEYDPKNNSNRPLQSLTPSLTPLKPLRSRYKTLASGKQSDSLIGQNKPYRRHRRHQTIQNMSNGQFSGTNASNSNDPSKLYVNIGKLISKYNQSRKPNNASRSLKVETDIHDYRGTVAKRGSFRESESSVSRSISNKAGSYERVNLSVYDSVLEKNISSNQNIPTVPSIPSIPTSLTALSNPKQVNSNIGVVKQVSHPSIKGDWQLIKTRKRKCSHFQSSIFNGSKDNKIDAIEEYCNSSSRKEQTGSKKSISNDYQCNNRIESHLTANPHIYNLTEPSAAPHLRKSISLPPAASVEPSLSAASVLNPLTRQHSPSIEALPSLLGASQHTKLTKIASQLQTQQQGQLRSHAPSVPFKKLSVFTRRSNSDVSDFIEPSNRLSRKLQQSNYFKQLMQIVHHQSFEASQQSHEQSDASYQKHSSFSHRRRQSQLLSPLQLSSSTNDLSNPLNPASILNSLINRRMNNEKGCGQCSMMAGCVFCAYCREGEGQRGITGETESQGDDDQGGMRDTRPRQQSRVHRSLHTHSTTKSNLSLSANQQLLSPHQSSTASSRYALIESNLSVNKSSESYLRLLAPPLTQFNALITHRLSQESSRRISILRKVVGQNSKKNRGKLGKQGDYQ